MRAAQTAKRQVGYAGHRCQCHAVGQLVGSDLQHWSSFRKSSKRGGMILGWSGAGKNFWTKNRQFLRGFTAVVSSARFPAGIPSRLFHSPRAARCDPRSAAQCAAWFCSRPDSSKVPPGLRKSSSVPDSSTSGPARILAMTTSALPRQAALSTSPGRAVSRALGGYAVATGVVAAGHQGLRVIVYPQCRPAPSFRAATARMPEPQP